MALSSPDTVQQPPGTVYPPATGFTEFLNGQVRHDPITPDDGFDRLESVDLSVAGTSHTATPNTDTEDVAHIPHLTFSGSVTPLEHPTHVGVQHSIQDDQDPVPVHKSSFNNVARGSKMRIDRLMPRPAPYSPPGQHVCGTCERNFKTLRSLQRHQGTTSSCGQPPKRLYECLCGAFARPRKDQVMQHVRVHRGKSTELEHQLIEEH